MHINVLNQDYLWRVKQQIRPRYNSHHVTDVPAKMFCVEQIWFTLVALLEGNFELLVEVGETSLFLCSKKLICNFYEVSFEEKK